MTLKPLVVGETIITGGRTVGESDVNMFAGLVGDFTPIHIDETFAASTPHGERIAHGTLTMATAIGFATQKGIFGERVLGLLSINWDFSGVVKLGDTIRSKVTIENVRPTSKPGRAVATYAFDVINQRDESIQRGRMIVLVVSE